MQIDPRTPTTKNPAEQLSGGVWLDHLYSTALVLEEFGNVIAPGGAGVVIAPQSGHRLPPLTASLSTGHSSSPI